MFGIEIADFEFDTKVRVLRLFSGILWEGWKLRVYRVSVLGGLS